MEYSLFYWTPIYLALIIKFFIKKLLKTDQDIQLDDSTIKRKFTIHCNMTNIGAVNQIIFLSFTP